MTKLLFGQSYYLRFDPKLWEAMQPYPPLGTLYAASYMRAQGYDVALFDAMLAESEEEWAKALDSEQPDYAILYEDNFNYLSKMCLLRMREAAIRMIKMAKDRNLPVILCGADATDHAELYINAGADFVLLGVGDITLTELLGHLTGDIDTQKNAILGLVHGSSDGVITHNPRRPDIRDLDGLPFPAWDLVDVERYRDIWVNRHGYYSINMVTTRGCPYHCNWCAKPIWGQRYYSRSASNVVAEQKWLKETVRPDHIWFADDIMGLKRGWFQEYADEVDKEGARLPFKCLSRADLMLRNEKDIAALARAGCEIVWMGAESGSQSILNAMEKGTTVEQIYQATQSLHAHGVQVAFFLQFGYPGETGADIEKTLQMVRDCRPDDVGMSVSYPLPGTSFHERIQHELGDKQNWQDSADLAMMYRGPFVTDFYRQLHTVLHKEFRSQKAIQRWKALVPNPLHVRGQDVRELAATIYRLSSLPLARRKLERLARVPHEATVIPLSHMSLEEAAQPTTQDVG